MKNAGKVTNNLKWWRHDLMQITLYLIQFYSQNLDQVRAMHGEKCVNINQMQGMGGGKL